MTKAHEKAYEIFQKTREQRGLSLSEVANALHLTVSVIEQIEAGEFSHRHLAPVFMRGYIRSSAKYLGLPQETVDEIVKTFDTKTPIAPAVTETIPSPHKQPNSRFSIKKIFSYLVVVFALIIAASFWHHKQKTDAPATRIMTPPVVENAVTEIPPPALSESEDFLGSEPEENTPADVQTQTEENTPPPAEGISTEPEIVAASTEATPPPLSPPVEALVPEVKVSTPPKVTPPAHAIGPEVVEAQETP